MSRYNTFLDLKFQVSMFISRNSQNPGSFFRTIFIYGGYREFRVSSLFSPEI